MRVSVSPTPRRLARFSRRTLIVLRVLSGTVRIAETQESLFDGAGVPVGTSDGIQNWELPEMEFWICSDGTNAVLEVLLP